MFSRLMFAAAAAALLTATPALASEPAPAACEHCCERMGKDLPERAAAAKQALPQERAAQQDTSARDRQEPFDWNETSGG